MHEHEVLVFLLSLAVLLSAARLLGELARRLGFPLVFGELASGILLGPTVFGRAAARARMALSRRRPWPDARRLHERSGRPAPRGRRPGGQPRHRAATRAQRAL